MKDWIQHNGLVHYPEPDLRHTWEKLWKQHMLSLNDHWTVPLVRQLRRKTQCLVWHVLDHEGSHAHVFCPGGRGKWSDSQKTHFCIVACLKCRREPCNKRMESQTDGHWRHFCRGYKPAGAPDPIWVPP